MNDNRRGKNTLQHPGRGNYIWSKSLFRCGAPPEPSDKGQSLQKWDRRKEGQNTHLAKEHIMGEEIEMLRAAVRAGYRKKKGLPRLEKKVLTQKNSR